MSKKIAMIVPPGNGGVLDYAEIVSAGISKEKNDVSIISLSKDTANSLAKCLATFDCIYLQYSGYGFAKRGAPLWLLRFLQQRRAKIAKLGIYFHELYAHGTPWQSAFWLSPVQRHVAISLANLADFWVTNRESAAYWLKERTLNKPSATLPVISNVGESSAIATKREKCLVVFGGPPRRTKIWEAAGASVFNWAARNGVTLLDVGAPLESEQLIQLFKRHAVVQCGRLPRDEVRGILQKAMFGLISCPIEFIAKSGVYAAYCANGVAPIIICDDQQSFDGLKGGTHYFAHAIFDEQYLPVPELVAANAWGWYQKHSLNVHLGQTTNFLVSSPLPK